jgi:hypothetical protein
MIKPPYLPRLWDVSRVIDAINKIERIYILLERNYVRHGNQNELGDAAPTNALDSAAYD